MDESTGISNADFARRVGCHHTMASRLRSGQRRPSTDIMAAAVRAFGLSEHEQAEWLEAVENGAEFSGAWMRDHIFNREPEQLPA